jgi:drug/metabolite transporter (DMT)-like permease
VSTAAPLIRVADAPTLAIAFWRNALALPVLAVVVAWPWGGRSPAGGSSAAGSPAGVSSAEGSSAGGSSAAGGRVRATTPLGQRERRLSTVAGLFLAAHFATWVPSLSFTSVASSVALVATQPVWAAVIARGRGEHVPVGAWWGIGAGVAGVIMLSGVDVSVEPRALFGDLLALAGGVFAAAYVTVGAQVRRTLPTSVYSLVCYGVAAGALLVVCLAGRQPLAGGRYDAVTWLALVGLMAGPQLLGHTVMNRVLGTTSPTLVSVAILFEIVGAGLLAWAAFGEVPPATAAPAGVLIALGVVLVVRAGGGAQAVSGAPALE